MISLTKPHRDNVLMVSVVTAIALAFRVVQVVLMSDAAVNPHWLRPVMDAGVYDEMARGLLSGTWPPAQPFFSAPLYPFLLAGLYAVFGAANPLPVLLVHALASAMGAGLAALIAARLWDRLAGWLAGLIYGTLWTSVFFAAELLAVSFTVPLLMLALWLLLRIDGSADGPISAKALFGAGLALGIAALARPNLLVLVPVAVWYLGRYRGLAWRAAGWVVLAAGLAVAILPATGFNLIHGGAPVLITNSGGVNFYIGNNPQADGASVILPDIPPTRRNMVENLTRAAEREAGHSLDPVAVDRHYLGKAQSFWASDPQAALSLQVRKLRLLTSMHERSNTKNLFFWRDRSRLLKWPLWLGWTPVLALALLGFWRRDLEAGARFLLLAGAVAFAITLLLFFVNGRFRLPLLAMLTVPAGGGLAFVWAAWRSRRWDATRGATLAVVAAVVISVMPDFLGYNPRDSFGDPSIWYSLGNSYLGNGDDGRAAEAYQRAIVQQRARPQPTFALIEEPLYSSLGDIYTRHQRVNDALQLYTGWVRTNPRSLEARVRLGDVLLQSGRIDEAGTQFKAVLQRDSEHLGATIGAGWVSLYRGDYENAQRLLEAAHRREPHAHALFGAGLALMELGRTIEAERAFREVLVLDGTYWQAWGNLAGLHESQGHLDKAAEAYRKVLEANPQDDGAREWLRRHPDR